MCVSEVEIIANEGPGNFAHAKDKFVEEFDKKIDQVRLYERKTYKKIDILIGHSINALTESVRRLFHSLREAHVLRIGLKYEVPHNSLNLNLRLADQAIQKFIF